MTVSEKGTLVWRPTEDQAGEYLTILRVKDDRGGVALQAFNITVEQGNRDPLFTSVLPDNAQPQVGKLFQYQAEAIDPDGDTLTYSLVVDPRIPSESPSNASIDSATGVVSWTPTAQQEGGSIQYIYADEPTPWRITVLAEDGRGGEALQELFLRVDPAASNRTPMIESQPRTIARLGNTYSYQVQVVDPDG
ncbi:MAG: hypothetical protein HC921_22435, partial [Synechococcaceae cyanobacterium SM2_3_1]|nr:hypothetical protein [Synechococcaceae cyanobacterium SM2_3_1]